MPFIGPFLQSVNPKMDEYLAKWASGDLSCVSVFHKYDQLDIRAAIPDADRVVQICGHGIVSGYGTEGFQLAYLRQALRC